METYRKLIPFLKKKFPIEKKVKIHRTKTPIGCDGLCESKNDCFLIRIDKTLPEYYAIDVLLHEYAHVIAWGKDKSDVHGTHWGKSYSKIYRTYLKEFK